MIESNLCNTLCACYLFSKWSSWFQEACLFACLVILCWLSSLLMYANQKLQQTVKYFSHLVAFLLIERVWNPACSPCASVGYFWLFWFFPRVQKGLMFGKLLLLWVRDESLPQMYLAGLPLEWWEGAGDRSANYPLSTVLDVVLVCGSEKGTKLKEKAFDLLEYLYSNPQTNIWSWGID